VLAGQKPVGEEEFLTSEQVISEAVFLGLRLLDGIDLRQFSALYGVDLEEKFAASITKMRQMQLLELGEDCLRLSAKGRLLANEVFMAFV
jgi:oxygen-independent coproporphyrinogen-3 oxidase